MLILAFTFYFRAKIFAHDAESLVKDRLLSRLPVVVHIIRNNISYLFHFHINTKCY